MGRKKEKSGKAVKELKPQPLDVYLFLQSEVMATYAFAQGKTVPESTLTAIRNARKVLSGEKGPGVTINTSVMARTHSDLAALVAPARPGTLLLIERFQSQKQIGAWLGVVPLIRRLILLALFLLVGLITVSLSPDINYEQLGRGMFGHSGQELLLNLLLLLFASGLGATFSGLYTTINAVKGLQYDEIEEVSFFVRFTMGLITGLFITELIPIDIDPSGEGDGTSGAIGKVTMAVLGGFSAHILYGILTKMVKSFESMVGEGDDMLKEIGRLDSQVQKQMASQAAARDRQPVMETAPAAEVAHPVASEQPSPGAAPSISPPSSKPPANSGILSGPPVQGWEVPTLLSRDAYFTQAHPTLARSVKSIPRHLAFSGALAKYDKGGSEDIYNDAKVKQAWRSLDQVGREKKVYWLACKNTVDHMVGNAGFRDTGSQNAIALLKATTQAGKFHLAKADSYDAAVASLNENLAKRIPVVAGVSYGKGAGWRPSGQNHFILIVGRSQDAKGQCYTFFDPGRSYEIGSDTDANRLYLGKNPEGNPHAYFISGKLAKSKKNYILCEVRQMAPK